DGQQMEYQLLRWMRPPERGIFKDRLYLLDENQNWIIGAEMTPMQDGSLEVIEVDGQAVGWIGFAPMGRVLPPDAERFLGGQVRITVISFVIALVVAVALAYLLAQKVSRPVRQLGDTVKNLSRGDYHARVPVESRDETGMLAGCVNQLAETLEKNRTARQRWMADIAHELRTPVAILKGEVEAMADGIRPADERMSASLLEEINQLSKLVDDLQTLAMSDAGALNIQKEPTDLTDLVLQCVDSLRDRLTARGISVDLRLGEAVTVMADQRRLKQLLVNLLENSCRYVHEGGCVRVVLGQNSKTADMTLEDSGPGLETVQIEKLFERFYRAEIGRSRSGGGTGLGLSICKNIVEAHGGSIQAEHSELGGLKIQVSLPV
ncbi:MAG: ATP-binding protein, partial [Xanthomonadales bacterium]|nr:ATP-binding protein [Xanthomonadales bacterium]